MTRADQPAFFAALSVLAECFSDPLSPVRQQVYWDLCQHVALEAWQYACRQAMATQLFHKTPLPAVLLGFAEEWRQQQQHRRRLDGPLEDPRTRHPQTPDAGVAIRGQLRSLADSLAGAHPVYRAPSRDDPLERKRLLRAQVRQVLQEEE